MSRAHPWLGRFASACLCLALVLGQGCKDDPPAEGEAPEASEATAGAAAGGPAGEEPAAAAGAPAAEEGAPRPTADAVPQPELPPLPVPELGDIAKEAAACERGKAFTDEACPALKRLGERAEELGNAAAFESLLALVERGDAGVRNAAAVALRSRVFRKAVWGTERYLVRCLDALNREQDGAVLEAVGGVVGRFRLAASGHEDEVLTMLRKHPRPEARKGMLLHLLFVNRGVEGVFKNVRRAAQRDVDTGVREAALGAFWGGGAGRRDEVVALWKEALSWPEDALAASAAYMLGNWEGGVPEGFQAVLDETARRARVGSLSWRFLAGLKWYVENGKPFVDRQKVFDVARIALTNRKLDWMVRNRAADVMRMTRAPGLQEALEPLRSDPEPLVAKHVDEILAN